MNAVIQEAIKRGVGYGLLVAGLAFFGALQQFDDWRTIVGVTGIAFCSYFVPRNIEGYRDYQRSEDGRSIPGDVAMASDKLDVVKIA